ncbi:alpha/beta fold hydrolase [Pedobacter nyackensis]|uniref:alpha/beta hydrolase n=1 Tax=Pedobacter nyackensis TaxID=475255 RepID=UPI00292F60E3|nr:alpha/beta fold hydrolase [Pedobacter nyackensis]
MKSLSLAFITLFICSSGYAQNNAIIKQRTAEFISYFNAEKADSLYILLADKIKSELPLTTLGSAIQQLKAAHGNLSNSEYFGTQQGINVYIAMFEKPGLVLHINFDKTNQVIGFFTMADQRELSGSVTIKTATATLKGTISVPEVTRPVPVVLLIAGSGPTDRDGNSLLINGKSNYFQQLSDSLKLKNIAVLRYDKRGVGQSTTSKALADVTFEDMVDDAGAIIKMLKTDKRFSKVIVAGHSEGSLVGMLAAEREKADAFISLSGSGTSADVILKTQLKAGVSPADYRKATSIIDSIKMGNFTKQKMEGGFNSLFNSAVQPYLYSWMKYDPKQVISKLNVPVLIIQGANDIQVSVDNAHALKKAAPNAVLELIPEMSHILKKAPIDKQQNMATYTMPDLPLHPQLIQTMTQFIYGLN